MLTFLHRYGSIDELLPARVDEPSLHACYHLMQALRVTAHDLIKLCKLSRSEEDFGDSKSEVLVLHSNGTEQGPAECPGIQSGQFLGQAGLVPATHTAIKLHFYVQPSRLILTVHGAFYLECRVS